MPRRARTLPPPRRHAVRRADILRTAARRLSILAAAGVRLARHGLGDVADLARRHAHAPRDVRAALRRWRAGERAPALPYTRDERQALALVVLPVLLVASAVAVHQEMRRRSVTVAAVETPQHEVADIGPGAARHATSVAVLPRSVARAANPEVTRLDPVLAAGPRIGETGAAGTPLAAAPPGAASTTVAPAPLTPVPPQAAAPTRSETAVAVLAPAGDKTRLTALSIAPVPLQGFEVGPDGTPLPALCVATPAPRATASAAPPSSSREDFGLRLAEAAESQVGRLVIYNEAYRRIPYPMGDVHEMYGVCTDVVVRAYRGLGLDLQVLVHEARAGSGDTSIDHRRTEVLRRFFATQGESLPVTPFAEDYLPGDIVTYDRPHNRRSRAHIAIVSSAVAPSGRPMIVHNRGWGPALEDALFVDRITGHYRYRGPGAHGSAVRQASAGAVAP